MTGSPTTTIKVKVWRVGTAEPAGWDFQTTDSSSICKPRGGSACEDTYIAAPVVALTFDDYIVTDLAGASADTAGTILAAAPSDAGTPVLATLQTRVRAAQADRTTFICPVGVG